MSKNEHEKRETLAAIVAMIRECAELYAREADKSDGLLRETFGLSAENFNTIADRVEAAWKREKAEIEANALAVGGVVEAERKREAVTNCNHIGNKAAMRKTLEEIHNKVNSLDEECGVDPVEIRDLARAALAEPPRNCDFYDNKTDAETRFAEETGENDTSQHYWQMFAIWLFAPASERKGDGDGE